MASLQSQYEKALAGGSADAFAPHASLHYITTLTSLHGAAAIATHLHEQGTQYRVKHKVLSAVEAGHNLSLEAETTLQFVESAGAYLPGLDDNFIVDRAATLPTVHFVSFDAAGRILQVRVFWDQGSLLKSVEVIGARAKQWPIRDGKDQARLVASSVAGQQPASESQESSRRQSRVGANGDKHTSLNIFEKPKAPPREESPAHRDIAPRASAKPAPRDYHDLFAGGAERLPEDDRPSSPIKEYRNAIKSGAGKHYQTQRVIGDAADDGDGEQARSPEKGIKTNPLKYDHFEFGERPFDPKDMPKPRHGKALSQWSFEDFTTPKRPGARRVEGADQSQRHFGWSDDEEGSKPIVFRQHNPAPRPDAKPQFEITDEVRDAGGRDEPEAPLGNVTNKAARAGHSKNFSSQFEIQDDSPRRAADAGQAEHDAARKKPEASARVSKALETHWDLYDESPKAAAKGIKIAGDGMGSRKTAEKSWWEYDE